MSVLQTSLHSLHTNNKMTVRAWLIGGAMLCAFALEHSCMAKAPHFKDVGCYQDRVGDRALPELIENFRGGTTEDVIRKCAEAAAARGFQVFAVQFFGECWSGEDAGKTYAKYGKSNNCLSRVGRHISNFVFEFYEPSIMAVGCFKDKADSRAMPELIANYRGKIDWKDTSKTITFCAQEAATRGYEYFGIQFYGECWSGKTAGKTYDKYGAATSCWESVGRKWTNFVFRFQDYVARDPGEYKTK